MAAISRLPRSTLRQGLGAARYRFIREVGGAAQATVDVDFFPVPLTNVEDVHRQEERRGPHWVFLGCPGVGKGTYASRLAKLVGVPHIAMGDLVRQELKSTSAMSKQVRCLGQIVSTPTIPIEEMIQCPFFSVFM